MIHGKLGEHLADPAWVEKLVEKGRAQLYTMPDPSIRGAAADGLDHLMANREEIADLSSRTFVAISARLSLDQVEQARLEWLANRASFEERMAALDVATDASLQRMEDDAEAWARAKKVALEFLHVAGQIAVPLLLAAL